MDQERHASDEDDDQEGDEEVVLLVVEILHVVDASRRTVESAADSVKVARMGWMMDHSCTCTLFHRIHQSRIDPTSSWMMLNPHRSCFRVSIEFDGDEDSDGSYYHWHGGEE